MREQSQGRMSGIWLVCFAVLSSWWCVAAGREIGPTFDEPFYLESGLQFWRTGSFGPLLSKGAMPLPMAVCTAPVRAYELWRGIPIDLATEFDFALGLARPATLLFWWLLLVYAHIAAAQIAGPWGGRLAVALIACEPTLLANAALATTDIAITACLLVFAVHFRAGRESNWWRRIGLCGLLYGVALCAKASALAFGVLIMATLELTRLWGQPDFRTHLIVNARRLIADMIQIGILGLLFTLVACGSDWKAERSFVAWAQTLPDGVFGQSVRWLSEQLTIFPNAFVAIVRQIKHNMQGHGAYLLGETSPTALWYFFPVALTIKLSLPLLLLPVVLAIIAPNALRNRMLALAVVFLVFSLNCRVQIGVRLVLPLIAFLAIGVGAALGCAQTHANLTLWRRKILVGASGIAVAVMASSCAWVWPHGLCYTNELWGGTAQAYNCVGGSDYDWGQGVRELDRWRERNGRGVSLLYYGSDPLARSDHFTYLHAHELPAPDHLAEALAGRDLAVSVSLLHGPRLIPDRTKPDRLNPLLDHLRAQRPVERTRFFVIYRFADL